MQVAETLFAYGANPDAKARDESTCRQLAQTQELFAMLDAYDADGAAAFEDPPGVWDRDVDAEGVGQLVHSCSMRADCSTTAAPTQVCWSVDRNCGQPASMLSAKLHGCAQHLTAWACPLLRVRNAWRCLPASASMSSHLACCSLL